MLVVGGVIFEMTTGILNIEYTNPISFYTGHFYGAWAFMAGFAIHICMKFGEMVRHVRVPTVISGLLFVIFAPMIFRLSKHFEGITGFSENVYLWNWLLVSAILFGASGVLFLVRLGRARQRVRRGSPAAADA